MFLHNWLIIYTVVSFPDYLSTCEGEKQLFLSCAQKYFFSLHVEKESGNNGTSCLHFSMRALHSISCDAMLLFGYGGRGRGRGRKGEGEREGEGEGGGQQGFFFHFYVAC